MIEFEHSLFKLLLLVAVLSAKPPGRKWLPLFIIGGLLLAFLPPAVPLTVPWDILLGLIIPLLLWQNARRIITAQWNISWKDIIVWLGTAVLFAIVFLSLKELKFFGAVLFGLITASTIWSTGETEETASIVSLIGPFTLIFLLAEVDPMILTGHQYFAGLFSGLSFGVGIALVAVYVSNKVNGKTRNWIAMGQIYLAYGFAYFMDSSAVVASLSSVIVYVTAGLYLNFWNYKRVQPTPLNTWPGLIFILVLFLFLGWQSHYPPSNMILVEAVIGFVLSLLIVWAGQRLRLKAFPQKTSIWRIVLKISPLLFTALLIWPRDTLQQPVLLAYAIGIAVLNLIVIRLTFNYFFE